MNIIIGNILSFFGGFIDFIFDIKFNEKAKILKGNCLTTTLSIISYIFLKAYDAIISAVVTLVRLITIYIKDKLNKKCSFLFLLFISLYALVFLNYLGVQTIILFLSNMCSFIPKWIFKDMQKIRIGGICAYILSIAFNIMIHNYAVILIQLISMMLVVIAFIRWHNEGNKKKKRRK